MVRFHTVAKELSRAVSLKQKFGLYREPEEIGTMRIAPVYELIKTLTPGELKIMHKRSESTGAAFIGLLNVMATAAVNNEADFKKQFAVKFKGVNYSETKSYLYRFLLRNLTAQQPDLNAFAQISYNFATAEMLYARGLADEAIATYRHADKTAQQEGFYQLSVVAIRRIKNLKLKTQRTANDYKEIRELHKREHEAIKMDRDVSEAMMLYTDFVQLIERYGGPVNKKVLLQFEKIVAHPLIKKRANIKSAQARLVVFDLITNYYWLTDKIALFRKEYETELKHYTPAMLKNPYYAYRNIFMLHNLANNYGQNHARAKMYTQLLAKAPAPDKKTADYKRLFLLYPQIKSNHATDVLIKKTVAQVKAELEQPWLQGKHKERMSLLCHLLQMLMERGEFALAEEFLLPALNNKGFEENLPAEFTGLRLFYLIVLFEQKRFAEMELFIRATRYALKTRDLESEVSVLVLALFGGLMRNAAHAKQKQTIGKIKAVLGDIKNYKYQRWGIHSFLESEWFKKLLEEI